MKSWRGKAQCWNERDLPSPRLHSKQTRAEIIVYRFWLSSLWYHHDVHPLSGQGEGGGSDCGKAKGKDTSGAAAWQITRSVTAQPQACLPALPGRPKALTNYANFILYERSARSAVTDGSRSAFVMRLESISPGCSWGVFKATNLNGPMLHY